MNELDYFCELVELYKLDELVVLGKLDKLGELRGAKNNFFNKLSREVSPQSEVSLTEKNRFFGFCLQKGWGGLTQFKNGFIIKKCEVCCC